MDVGLLERLSRVKALRTFVGAPLFEASRRAWPAMPESLRGSPPLRAYGDLLQRLARLRQSREQSSWTCFFRNRAETAYIVDLARSAAAGARFSIGIFGCSTGAEAFSTAYALREQSGRIAIEIHASDISPENIEAAMRAEFASDGPEMEGLTADERDALFEPAGAGVLKVREQFQRNVRFTVLDALAPGLGEAGHDVVLANKFLCHMPPERARRALRNIVTAVRPGGTLLVSGVDLDVRSAVARELGLIPDESAIEALHEGDHTLRRGWPLEYWGLEPLDPRRRDYAFRYAAAHRKPGANPFQRAAPDAAAARDRRMLGT
jgi:SAM-dependent methyltransferase